MMSSLRDSSPILLDTIKLPFELRGDRSGTQRDIQACTVASCLEEVKELKALTRMSSE